VRAVAAVAGCHALASLELEANAHAAQIAAAAAAAAAAEKMAVEKEKAAVEKAAAKDKAKAAAAAISAEAAAGPLGAACGCCCVAPSPLGANRHFPRTSADASPQRTSSQHSSQHAPQRALLGAGSQQASQHACAAQKLFAPDPSSAVDWYCWHRQERASRDSEDADDLGNSLDAQLGSETHGRRAPPANFFSTAAASSVSASPTAATTATASTATATASCTACATSASSSHPIPRGRDAGLPPDGIERSRDAGLPAGIERSRDAGPPAGIERASASTPQSARTQRNNKSKGWNRLATAVALDTGGGGGVAPLDTGGGDGTLRCWASPGDEPGAPLPSLRYRPLTGTMEDAIQGGGAFVYHGAREPGTDLPVGWGGDLSGSPAGFAACFPPVAARQALLEALLLRGMVEAEPSAKLAVLKVCVGLYKMFYNYEPTC